MDNWESLIASRMRPCESMPRHADPTKERKRMAHNRYYASEKGKEKRKGADARFRANHREERNKYNHKYYQAHKEYFAEYQKKYRAKEGCMKAGRKPILTFSEQVKLRSIQAAFGKDSPEEAQFWEQASTSAKLRRAIKRGKNVAPTPRKYKTYAEAHNAANKVYYQRHKDKVSEKNRRWYERNKERKKAYYEAHKGHIRTYYKEWYEKQKEVK